MGDIDQLVVFVEVDYGLTQLNRYYNIL